MSRELVAKLQAGPEYAFPFPLSPPTLKYFRMFVYGIKAGNVPDDIAAEMVQLAKYLQMDAFTAYVKCVVSGLLAITGVGVKQLSQMKALECDKALFPL